MVPMPSVLNWRKGKEDVGGDAETLLFKSAVGGSEAVLPGEGGLGPGGGGLVGRPWG